MDLISKIEAKEKGLSFYFTGKRCRNGGVAPRRVSNNQCTCEFCKKIASEANKKYKQTDVAKERDRLKSKRYYRNNKEKHRVAVKRWKENNIDFWRDYQKKWWQENWDEFYKQNRHKYIENAKKRSFQLEKSTPIWVDRNRIKTHYDLVENLRDATGIDWQVDHIYPLQGKEVCGLHVAENLQPMPAYLNEKKGNKMLYTGYLDWLDDYNQQLFTPVSFC